jgi:hypothetical protein
MIGVSVSAPRRKVVMSQLESVAGVQSATTTDLPNFGAMGQGVYVLFLDLGITSDAFMPSTYWVLHVTRLNDAALTPGSCS